MPVRTENCCIERLSEFRTIEVPGDKESGQALEGHVFNAVAIIIPPALDNRIEGAFFGMGQESGSPEYSLTDAPGAGSPFIGGCIAAREFGQLMSGGGLAEIVALAELGLTHGFLLGLSGRGQPEKRDGQKNRTEKA
jgi:hypothetical protein